MLSEASRNGVSLYSGHAPHSPLPALCRDRLELLACVLVIALWVRSYYSPSRLHFVLLPLTIQSWKGIAEFDPKLVRVGSRFEVRTVAAVPHWCFILLTLTIAGLPWVRWQQRFTLRALLIIMTLAALTLAAIGYALR